MLERPLLLTDAGTGLSLSDPGTGTVRFLGRRAVRAP